MIEQAIADAPSDETHDPVISIRMPPALVEKIDSARGQASRSAFIRLAVERQTKLKRKPA